MRIKSIYSIFLVLFCLSILVVVFYPKAALFPLFASLLFAVAFLDPLTNLSLIICFMFLRDFSIIFPAPYREVSEVISLSAIPIVFGYLVILLGRTRRVNRKTTAINITAPMLFILFWSFVAMIWTEDPFHGIVEIFQWVICIFIVEIFVKTVTKEDELAKVLNVFPFLALLLTFMIIAAHLGYTVKDRTIQIYRDVELYFPLFLKMGGRPGGLMYSTEAAQMLIFGIFGVLSLLYKAKAAKKAFLFFIIVISIICIFMTASKSGVGALILSLLFFVWLVPALRRWLFSTQFLILGSVVILMFVSDLLITKGIFTKRVGLVISGEQGFLRGRLGYWSTGMNHLLHTYGLGVGTGGFAKYIQPVIVAHSIPFSILFDLGIIGFLFLLWIFIKVAMKLRKAMSKCRNKDDAVCYRLSCLVAALFAMSIYGIIGQEYTYYPFWVLVGLTLCAAEIVEGQCISSVNNLDSPSCL